MQDHGIEVQMWCDELTPLIDVPTVSVNSFSVDNVGLHNNNVCSHRRGVKQCMN